MKTMAAVEVVGLPNGIGGDKIRKGERQRYCLIKSISNVGYYRFICPLEFTLMRTKNPVTAIRGSSYLSTLLRFPPRRQG